MRAAATCCSTAPTTRPAPRPWPPPSTTCGRRSLQGRVDAARGRDGGQGRRRRRRRARVRSPVAPRRPVVATSLRRPAGHARARISPLAGGVAGADDVAAVGRSGGAPSTPALAGRRRAARRRRSLYLVGAVRAPARRRPRPARSAAARDDGAVMTTALATTRIGPATFAWGTRTFVMGILNVTPGLVLGRRPARRRAIPSRRRRRRRAGWSPRAPTCSTSGASRPGPGHAPVDAAAEEPRRVVPGRRRAPRRAADDPDQHRHDEAGRRRGGPRRRRGSAQRRVGRHRRRTRRSAPSRPLAACRIVLMHNRAEAALRATSSPRSSADLRRGGRAGASRPASPPGNADRRSGHRLRQDRGPQPRAAPRPGALRVLGRPILLGTSRKSTLGQDPRPARRGAARGARSPRRRWASPPGSTSCASTTCGPTSGPPGSRTRSSADVAGRTSPGWRPTMTDRIVLTNMRFEGRHGVHDWEQRRRRSRSRSTSSWSLDLRPAGVADDLAQTVDYGAGLRGRAAGSSRDRRCDLHRGPGRGASPATLLARLPRSTRSSSGSASRPSSWAARSTMRRSRSGARATDARRDAGPADRTGRGAALGMRLEVGGAGPQGELDGHRLAVAEDLERDRSRPGRYWLRRRVERVLAVDRHAVDLDDDVAVLEAGVGGRGVRAGRPGALPCAAADAARRRRPAGPPRPPAGGSMVT